MTGLYRGPDDVLYQITDSDSFRGIVELCAAGGGIIHHMTDTTFRQKFKPDQYRSYKPGRVTIDFYEVAFDCWLRDQFWNGWECPVFTFEQAKALTEFFTDLTHVPKGDRFVIYQDDVPEVYPGHDVDLAGVMTRVYGIGSGSWTWDRIEEQS